MNYIYAAIAVVAFICGFYLQGLRMDAEISSIRELHANELTLAVQKAADESNELQRKKDEVLKKAQAIAAKNATAAAAAKYELDWVRDYNQRNSAAINSSTCTSVRDYSATTTTVFGECTVALEEMARKADGHALDARTLKESWPVLKDIK
jgi:low affinity Fe/Cu permease